MARTHTRSRSAAERRYPAWVFVAREDLTRANMELYDRQQDATRARCDEIRPGWTSLPFLDRMDVWTQARKDLGLSYFEIDTGRIRSARQEV